MPPLQVTLRARRASDRVTLTLDTDRRVHAHLPGHDGDLIAAGELLAALGSAPGWYEHLCALTRALPHLDEADLPAALTHAGLSRPRRGDALQRIDPPVWLAWMLALDPDPRIRTAFAEGFPVGTRYEPVAVALLDDTERIRNTVLAQTCDRSMLVVRAAATHPDPAVRAALIRRHPRRVPEDLHPVLALDPDPDVRRLLAAKIRLRPDLADLLLDDEHVYARMALARDQRLTPAQVETLAADPCPSVRVYLAERQRLTPAAARALASNANESIARALLHNTSCSEESREVLRNSPNPSVADEAWEHHWAQAGLSYGADAARSSHPAYQRWLEHLARPAVQAISATAEVLAARHLH